MAQHARLCVDTGVEMYFCDPHSPWQRGSNQNTNGLLRQYFPKGTDLARHSRSDLNAVALTLNTRPRKTLAWKTPAEALDELLHSAGQAGVATTPWPHPLHEHCLRPALARGGMALSMGSTGDAYDNALAESFFATLETELIDRSSCRTKPDARLAVFDYIEAFYNPPPPAQGPQPGIPAEYERRDRHDQLIM